MEASRLEELLARAESNTLPPDDYPTIETLVKSYTSLIDLLQDKSTSLARLRKLLFGASTEKLRDLFPDVPPLPAAQNRPAQPSSRPADTSRRLRSWIGRAKKKGEAGTGETAPPSTAVPSESLSVMTACTPAMLARVVARARSTA